MTRLGADPEALRDLGAALRRSASELDRIASGLDGRVRAAGWRGPDARRFEQEWVSVQRVRLVVGSQRCAELATTLLRQADQQERASAGVGDGTWFARGDALSIGTPGSGASPSSPTAGSDARDVAADRDPPVPSAPLSERRYLGGLDLTVAFGTVAITGDLAIQQLQGDRVRVVLGESAGAGAFAGAGGRVDVAVGDETPDPVAAAGLSAAVVGRLGAVERRSWTVRSDEVEGLVRRLGAEAVSDATPMTPLVDAAAGVLDRAAESLTGLDPGLDQLAEPPRPDATEQLAEISVLATAGVGLGLGGGGRSAAGVSGASSGQLRAGMRQDGHGATATTSAVIEAHGTAAGALGATLLGRLGAAVGDSVDATGSLRVELPVTGDDRGRHAFVTLTSGDGATTRETRAVVDLHHPAIADAAMRFGSAGEALRDGDPHRALELLRSVRVPEDAVTSETVTAEVSGSSARAGGRLALGPGVGISARGHVLDVQR